jgi:hypothetical protein
VHRPAYYRKRAAALNKLAQEADSPTLRDSYLKLALQWEALAEKAEQGKHDTIEAGEPGAK